MAWLFQAPHDQWLREQALGSEWWLLAHCVVYSIKIRGRIREIAGPCWGLELVDFPSPKRDPAPCRLEGAYVGSTVAMQRGCIAWHIPLYMWVPPSISCIYDITLH